MQTKVDEPIEVLARFKSGRLTPLVFKLQNRVLKIDSVDLCYDFTQGDVKFLSYSVSCSGNSYKIVFNTSEITWKLEEIFTA